MQVTNPLVPPPIGQAGGTPAPVANAPNVPASGRTETSRPVTAARDGERTRAEDERRPREERPPARGTHVNIRV